MLSKWVSSPLQTVSCFCKSSILMHPSTYGNLSCQSSTLVVQISVFNCSCKSKSGPSRSSTYKTDLMTWGVHTDPFNLILNIPQKPWFWGKTTEDNHFFGTIPWGVWHSSHFKGTGRRQAPIQIIVAFQVQKHLPDQLLKTQLYYSWLVDWTPVKNISQLGWLFPIYGKIKNVPNHQPDMDGYMVIHPNWF